LFCIGSASEQFLLLLQTSVRPISRCSYVSISALFPLCNFIGDGGYHICQLWMCETHFHVLGLDVGEIYYTVMSMARLHWIASPHRLGHTG
jgi:hypothetical protein